MKIPSLAGLTCREVVELVGDYMAGAMSQEDTARLEQHMHACTWCMTYLDQLRSTVSALAQLEPEAPAHTESTQARERLQALFRGMKLP